MSNFEEPGDGLEDMELVCVDQGEPFVLTASEQKFYSSKGLSLPKRCKRCREIKRQKNANAEAAA